jgi:hypothetical protein
VPREPGPARAGPAHRRPGASRSGLGIALDGVRDLPPLRTQRLSDEEQKRLANLGANGLRDVEGHTMTHCVPNERRRTV